MELNNLAMLIELARTSRDAAAVRRAQCQMRLDQARAQLQVLQSYSTEYGHRAQTLLAEGCDLAARNNLQAFEHRLGAAIRSQQAEVARQEQLLAAAEEELMQHQRRMKSLEALGARRRESLRQVQERREQKAMDEIASRRREPLAAIETSSAPQ